MVLFRCRTHTGFQSTLPVWGATSAPIQARGGPLYFNPRSPCGERHSYMLTIRIPKIFQSTLPVWGATKRVVRHILIVHISIHAPRVGSDNFSAAGTTWNTHFNPRSPCGERPFTQSGATLVVTFQSTLPVWGATFDWPEQMSALKDISIHAPRVGSDLTR